MKQLLSMFLVVAMLTCLLAGCAGSKTEASEVKPVEAVETSGNAETVNLTLWTPPIFAVGYLDALKQLVADYENEHNDVTIEIVELNWDGIGEKLETAMMTGSTPDIYIDGTARTAKLPSTGLVEDVSEIISSLDGWNTASTNIGKIDGNNFLVPLTQMPPQVMSINVSLVKEYGCYDMLPKDRVSWTWDDFMAFLNALAEKSVSDGVYPLNLYAGNQSSDISYYTMLLSAGAQILNADHSASAVNTDESVALIEKLKEVYDQGLTYPGAEALTDEEAQALFLSEKVIIDAAEGALSNLPIFQSIQEEGSIAEVPELESYAWPTLGKGETTIGNWGANCVAVFTNEGDSAKIAVAKDFIGCMLDNKEFSEILWASAPSYAPARDFGQVLDLSDEQLAQEAVANNSLAAYCTSDFGILESYWGEIRQYFYPQLQSLFLGHTTPEEAISSFEISINEVLNNR